MTTDTDIEQQIMATIDKWVDQELKPIAREFDQADKYPAELVEQMKELGLFGATIAEQYGGLGLSSSTYAKIVSRICEVWMAPSGIFNSHLIMASCVQRAGTEAQKEYFLPKFATGELRGGIGLTEPDAGSDLQAIRTVARRNGNDYVLNGTKTWISNGINGNCLAVLTKTNPDAEPRHTGMSLFLCEKGEGFTVGKKFKKLGYRSIDSAELIFEDFVVSADNLIGGVEGRGFQQVAGGLELGRINIAARGAGMAKGATDMALAYAMERKTFGKPIAEHQAIQLKLAEMSTRAAAATLLVQQAAKKYDLGERCDLEAGQAKFFASESAVQNSLDAMRVFGGYSYSPEYEIERFYRDAPLLCIGEGTNEIQRMIIAKQMVSRAR
ncbi:acyl-CoA dehydrogenase family protein [Flavobacteriaceae bacterium]|nr:acyl-CoA dehydrogenase family protein [Flavobacteriaceae bacterium]